MRKNPLKSKTMWGIAITAFAPFAPIVLQAAGVNNAPEVVQAVGTIFGAGLAVYGRIKAG